MRIGIIAPEFPPEIGGMQTYAFEYIRELIKLGHEIVVFTQPHESGEVTISGASIYPVLKRRRKLDKHILNTPGIDIWHVMNACYSWIALEVEPVFISIHGNDFLRPYILVARPDLTSFRGAWRIQGIIFKLEVMLGQWLTNRLVRKSLPKAYHIIANSKYTENVFLKKFPRCKNITSAGMVGVANDYFKTELHAKNNSANFRLLTVCRLSEPRKNVDSVLRALSKLKERYNFTYTIVGDGYLRNELEKLSINLGINDRVEFKGFIPHDEIKNLFMISDLFVLASSISADSHEGFGIVYLEANACGTPVLAARLAGAIEAVDDGVSGLLVDKTDEESIYIALEKILSGKVQFDSKLCRRFAQKFTWSNVVKHTLQYYESALHSS